MEDGLPRRSLNDHDRCRHLAKHFLEARSPNSLGVKHAFVLSLVLVTPTLRNRNAIWQAHHTPVVELVSSRWVDLSCPNYVDKGSPDK
jgi:hypothetical protein